MGCGGTGSTINKSNGCPVYQYICPDSMGCPPGVLPDFEIKRHDTLPPFVLSISDCNGPLDLTDCVAEVSMWAEARIKTAIISTDTSIPLADNIGFYQSLVGDIIVISTPRNPEQMLVVGFDEINKKINVQRGYNGTNQFDYKKGTKLKIFRILNAVAETKQVTESIQSVYDASFHDEVTDSQLIYNWQANDTCLAGCYWLEFKLLKMDTNLILQLANGHNTISTISNSSCSLGNAVLSVRRFPICDAFLIKICESPTAENIS
jgi:hypothetical protein